MKQETLEVDGKEYNIIPVDGSIKEGVLEVESVEVSTEDSNFEVEFNSVVPWDSVKDSILTALIEEKLEDEKVDLSGEDWEVPRHIRSDTDRFRVLKEIVDLGPIATGALEDNMPGVSVGSATYGLVEKGLVKCVGKVGRQNIYAATPMGVKEVASKEEIESLIYNNNGGLNQFFDNVNEEQEAEGDE